MLNLKNYLLLAVLALSFLTVLNDPIQAQVYINELLASNITVNQDGAYSDYSDWLELFNAGDQQIDLSGYSLSDDIANPGKWFFPESTTIPVDGYLLIWADGKNTGLHTNFKLQSSGEQVCLTDPDGEIIDSITFTEQVMDVSFGRDPADGSEWFYFSTPTPETVNSTPGNYGPVNQTQYSIPGGFYSGSQTIALSSITPGAIVRYTLDGTDPSIVSAIYSDPVIIESTTIIRSKCYKDGFLPSKTVTNTFFIDEGNFTLPVISISAAPEDLWDDDIGIYVEGNGDCGCGMGLTGNYCCRDWEKQIGLEFYETDGTKAFSLNAGLKIFGAGSRKRVPQRSLSIFARAEYGTAEIDYRIFPDKPIDEFKSFILRSSAHDWIKTLFRDALIQYLSMGYMDVDIQAYRPSVVFINGEYFGIHNIREKMNEEYLASNHGIDPDNVDILQKNSYALEGDNLAYEQLLDFVSTNDMTLDASYDYMKTKMDIGEYMDYLILHIFSAKADWPANNIKYWRPRTPDGVWRWMAYDMDFGFGLDTERFSRGTYDLNELALITVPNDDDKWINPSWSTLLFRKMIENPVFKEEFIQRYCNHINITFETQRVLDMIDSFKVRIEPEIPRHIDRWGGAYALELGYVFESLEEWDDNIEVMREFARKRPEYARQHLKDIFDLPATVDLNVTTSNKNGGIIEVNDIPVPHSGFVGTYFAGNPVTLKAVERFGYQFTGWTLSGNLMDTTLLIGKGSTWIYLDDGSDQDTAWTAIDFNDAEWKSGEAQLGYGDDDETTVIGYGPDPDNKYLTTYFRKEFNIDDPASVINLNCNILRDDGAIIYLNGIEVVRSNIVEGPVDYLTRADKSIPGTAESNYLNREISTDYLVTGKNVLAVEIHQYSGSSTDLSFDLELIAEVSLQGETTTYTEDEISLTLQGNFTAVASFQSLPQSIFINEFMADNHFAHSDDFGEFDDWIEIFNSSDTDVDLGGFYLTDDLDFPSLWQIPYGYPEQTTISAGQALLLWADNDTEQGPLHLGFRLSAAGEQIGLSDDGILYVDSLSFSVQIEDWAYGRYPDGDKRWQSLSIYTPGEMNQSTNARQVYLTDNLVRVYPNPTNGWANFNILTADPGPVNISIVDIMGNAIYHEGYAMIDEMILEFDLTQYSNGIYFVVFQFKDEVITCKLLLNK